MNFRSPALFVAAVSSAILSSCTSLNPPASDKRSSPSEGAQEKFEQILTRTDNRQFIVVNDTGGSYHSAFDPNAGQNVFTFLADDRTMKKLREHGRKLIELENRVEFQGIADKLAAGKITAEQYQHDRAQMYIDVGEPAASPARALLEANIVKAAAKYGIKIVYVEKQMPNLKAHSQLVDGTWSHIEAYDRLQADDYSRFVDKLRSSEEAKKIALDFKSVLEQRLSGDLQLSQFIKQQAGSEKTAVVYGYSHGNYPCTLPEFLNAPQIAVFPTASWMRSTLIRDFVERGIVPDYAITLHEGWGYVREGDVRNSQEDAVKNSRPIPSLVPDKFVPDICRALGMRRKQAAPMFVQRG